jgi:hypothetical protein
MRAPDHLVELLRPAGQADAELADDQAEALAVGAALDVVDEVERDRREGALDRDAAAVRQHRPAGTGLAVDEVLADQRLLAHAAGGAAVATRALARPELVEAVAGHLDLDRHLVRLGVGEVEVLDLAGADAADLQLAVIHEPEGVVELDHVLRALRVVAVRAGHDERGQARAQHEADDGEAPHCRGPTARCASTQSSSFCSSSLQTFEPS